MKFFPVCPHCSYTFDDDETWHSNHSKESAVKTNDGDESVVLCHNDDCKKQFKIICESTPMFSAEEIEDES